MRNLAASENTDQGLTAEIQLLKARLTAVTKERDDERILSGTQAEELVKLSATLKENTKAEKKNKKK